MARQKRILTEREQALADAVRGKNLVDPVFPEDYAAYSQLESVEKVTVETREGPVDVYIHRARDCAPGCPLFINIHGGGFVRPLIATNIRFCSRIAVEIHGIVVDVDYSLAPEYPYPIALHECYDVVKWVFAHAEELGTRPELISLGGHSAGANMTACIGNLANQTKEFRVRMQIMDFGAFDMATDPGDKPGWRENIIPLDRMRAFDELYHGGSRESARDPYISPLFAPDEWLTNQPETLLITGGTDTFRYEGEAYGSRLIANGTRVTMQRFPDSPHGFTVNCCGMWREAQDLIIQYLRQTTQVPPMK